MGSSGSPSFCGGLSKVLLILINVGFIVAGSLLIYFSVNITNSGWLDVFEGEYAYLKDATFYTMLGFGVLVIVIAIIGCLGAWNTNRALLTCYMVFIVIAFIIFLLISIMGFISMSTSNKWKDNAYPADSREPDVAINFDKVYCYSQATFYCNQATIGDILSVFAPGSENLFQDTQTLKDVCGQDSIQNIDAIRQLCEQCKRTEVFEKYNTIYDWTQDNCKANGDTNVWCSNFLLQNEVGDAFNGAPYGQCRDPFLSFWSKWSFRLGFGALIFSVAAIIIMILICCTKRQQANGDFNRV